MKILDRYVLISFIKNYLIAMMVLLGLYIVLDMVFNFDDLVDMKGTVTAQGLAGLTDHSRHLRLLLLSIVFDLCPSLRRDPGGCRGVYIDPAFPIQRTEAILAAGVPLLRVSWPIIFAAAGSQRRSFRRSGSGDPADDSQAHAHARSGPTGTSNFARGFPIQAMQDDQRSLLMASRFTPAASDAPARMLDVDVIERDADLRAHGSHLRRPRRLGPEVEAMEFDQRPSRDRPSAAGTPLARACLPSIWHTSASPDEIALYRSNEYVELLSTERINQLLTKPQSYGSVNLLDRETFARNAVADEPGDGAPGRPLRADARARPALGCDLTKAAVHHRAGHGHDFHLSPDRQSSPAPAPWPPTGRPCSRGCRSFSLPPPAIFLLDRLHTRGS